MSKIKYWCLWILVNGGFAALAGIWIFGNQEWAGNLFIVATVLLIVLATIGSACFLAVDWMATDRELAEGKLSGINAPSTKSPAWVSATYDGAMIVMLAGSGHIGWAFVWMYQALLEQMILRPARQSIIERRESYRE